MGSIGSGASPGETWQLADDTALTAGSPAEMQFMIDLMQEYCKHRGITLNLEKCAVMEVGRPHPPALQRNRYFMRDPKSGALVQLELVDTHKYLGIYFDSCLSMERNLQAALRSFWAAHHRAQAMGLRPGALPPLLRIHVWKAMVLPHITFRLPFMSKQQVGKMQTAMHLFLRMGFHFHSSPHLLLREVGVLPLEVMQAQVLACLFGTLETSHPHLHSFQAHKQFMSLPRQALPMYERFAWALRVLGLTAHMDQLQCHLLPAPHPRAPSLPPLPWAGPLLPYRQRWKSLVKKSAQDMGAREFLLWSSHSDSAHRAFQYGADAALHSASWRWGKPAPYLLWGLPSQVASQLLLLRSQATRLAAHASCWELQRSGLGTAEGFCPLCLGVPPHPQHVDSLFHLCTECPHLAGPRAQLFIAISTLHPHQAERLQKAWLRLPAHVQHCLLLGNYMPCMFTRLLPGSSKGQKMRHLLLATTPILHQMLQFCYNLSDVLHPVL